MQNFLLAAGHRLRALANLIRQKPGFAQMLMMNIDALKNTKQKLKKNDRFCACGWLAANEQGFVQVGK
jgi:hypothetical protein